MAFSSFPSSKRSAPMPKVVAIIDINSLYTQTRTGTVIDSQNWAENNHSTTSMAHAKTHALHHAMTLATRVESKASEELRIFIKETSGHEFEARFSNPGFGVRTGHKVSIICGGDQKTRHTYDMVLVNHTTQSYKIFPERIARLVPDINRALMTALLVSLPLLMMILSTLITGSGGLKPALLGVAATFAVLVFLKLRNRNLEYQITRVLSQEAETALRS